MKATKSAGALLQLRKVSRTYGERKALHPVDLELAAGRASPCSGTTARASPRCCGSPPDGTRPPAGRRSSPAGTIAEDDPEVRARVAVVGDTVACYPDLTVREHLELVTVAHAVDDADAWIDQVLADRRLTDHAHALPGSLSSGQLQSLLLASALVRPRDLLVLDEPEQRLDPDARRRLADLLVAEKQDGVAVLLATHQAELAEAVADRMIALDDGRVIADGRPRPCCSTGRRLAACGTGEPPPETRARRDGVVGRPDDEDAPWAEEDDDRTDETLAWLRRKRRAHRRRQGRDWPSPSILRAAGRRSATAAASSCSFLRGLENGAGYADARADLARGLPALFAPCALALALLAARDALWRGPVVRAGARRGVAAGAAGAAGRGAAAVVPALGRAVAAAGRAGRRRGRRRAAGHRARLARRGAARRAARGPVPAAARRRARHGRRAAAGAGRGRYGAGPRPPCWCWARWPPRPYWPRTGTGCPALEQIELWSGPWGWAAQPCGTRDRRLGAGLARRRRAAGGGHRRRAARRRTATRRWCRPPSCASRAATATTVSS